MKISDKTKELIWQCEGELRTVFSRFDAIEQINTERVLNAFHEEGISSRHFNPTNGYGYDDIGRDALDRLFAKGLDAESAFVRPQIVNGTHAIYLAVAANALPGTTVLSITGKPYDTLQEAFGIRGERRDSLKSYGVTFKCIPLKKDAFDLDCIAKALESDKSIGMIYIQRSRGYCWRNSLDIEQFRDICRFIRERRKDVCIVVDNCYGEFTATREPIHVGADLIAGSLIKNLGGGFAPCGGYIAGKQKYVEPVAHRVTVPGLGGEVGSYEASYRPFYQGFFMAPHTVNQCLKTAALFAAVFNKLGFETLPAPDAERSDIIQSVKLRSPEILRAFCAAIQEAAPIDSFVMPEEWDMPGYEDKVIMAAGTFVQGATTELSADGPMKEPYIAYMQGGITYTHGRIAAMMAVEKMLDERMGAK